MLKFYIKSLEYLNMCTVTPYGYDLWFFVYFNGIKNITVKYMRTIRMKEEFCQYTLTKIRSN